MVISGGGRRRAKKGREVGSFPIRNLLSILSFESVLMVVVKKLGLVCRRRKLVMMMVLIF